MKKRKTLIWIGDIVGCITAFFIFVVPFLFMLVNALKDRKGANKLSISLPETFMWDNFWEVIQTRNYQILTAFKNSALITIAGLFVLVFLGSMAGYVIQRRKDRVVRIANFLIMLGLMLPPAILPTIKLLQTMHLYKSFFSIVIMEAVMELPFTIMLYEGYLSSIPRELEEAACIDGCNRWGMFGKIIFPLLKPITATVIILNAVTIFNDFSTPLYFYPGSENATVQLTLYNFIGQFSSSYNLLFADVVLIVLPMLILFIIFNRKIVSGIVEGSVKG